MKPDTCVFLSGAFSRNGRDMDFVSGEKEHRKLSRQPAEREAWDETRGRLKAKRHELTCEAPRGKGSRMERERKLAQAVTYCTFSRCGWQVLRITQRARPHVPAAWVSRWVLNDIHT